MRLLLCHFVIGSLALIDALTLVLIGARVRVLADIGLRNLFKVGTIIVGTRLLCTLCNARITVNDLVDHGNLRLLGVDSLRAKLALFNTWRVLNEAFLARVFVVRARTCIFSCFLVIVPCLVEH